MKNLNYSLYTSDNRHPETVMKELGVRYMYAIPQSMFDSWHFWGCVNVPDKLPPNITEIKTNPRKAVGYGLSEKQARSIIRKARRANP